MQVTRRIVLAWLPAAAYMGFIWFLSSQPLTLPPAPIPFRDKIAHLIEYGILGALAVRAIVGSWPAIGLRRALLWGIVVTVSWGFLDELHQAFVPLRNADSLDLLADAIGALLGSACYAAFRRKRDPHAL
jgi:VanZ family protein